MWKENKREDTRSLSRLAWSVPWLLRYPLNRSVRLLNSGRSTGSRHLIIVIANHYEPSWTSNGEALSLDAQMERIDRWSEKALSLCSEVKGSDGVPLRHTYFYPGEQYQYRLIQMMAEMQAGGLGEVEVHLHHGVERPDTPDNLRAALVRFRDSLAEEHKCLSRMAASMQPMYGFVHGNWALANSAGGRFCGVDSEMEILAETGCYADFTLPSIYSRAQVPRVNAIYECGFPLSEQSPHRKGPNLRVGRTPVLPLLLTGPTIVDWRAAKRWPPVPRIDDGVVDSKYGLSMARLERWIRAGISVEGRPEWLFIKLYGHAFFPGDQDLLIGDGARRFFARLCESAVETGDFKVHFATAREAFNIAMAAVDGREGDPHQYRDFKLRPIMATSDGRLSADCRVEAEPVQAVGAWLAAGEDCSIGGPVMQRLLLPTSGLLLSTTPETIEVLQGRAPQPGQDTSRLQRSSQLVRTLCEVLQDAPNGLADSLMFSSMEALLDLTDAELEYSPSRPLLRGFELAAMRAAVAPIKAGWLIEESDNWRLTAEGRAALKLYPDPEEFLRQAAKRSRKGWLSVFMPALYWFVCNVKFRLTIETQLIRRVGLLNLFAKGLKIGAHWQKVLPVQEPRRVSSEVSGFGSHRALLDHLKAGQISFREGGHTIYLPPVSARRMFGELMKDYPDDAGLKIVKNPGSARVSYVYSGHTKISWIHRSLTYSHRHLVLVAGLLSSRGVGPRLFDLIEMKFGQDIVTAYIIQHVEGREPAMSECQEGIARIRNLEKQKLLKVILPDGFNDSDFACPSCNGNALIDGSGKFIYVDFQNFHLVDYGSYLKQVARGAQHASHFGDQSWLRGGRYLYQSLPGLRLNAKRDTDQRELELRRLLEEAGVCVTDKVVLDFGCNIGMMIALYLKMGAAWCHGWDLPHITEHAETLLLSLGCTRFSTTGVRLDRSRKVEADLSPFLRSRLEGCVISYLAVRENLGWLDSIATIPWEFLIYESHEHESKTDFEGDLEQLRQTVNFDVGAARVYRDGDCEPRFLALLIRRGAD